MMAASSIILAHKAPTLVLLPIDLYHGVSTVLLDVFSRFQVSVERVDMRNLMELRQTLERVHSAGHHHDVIVWIETPSNPMCHVLDIQAISQLVRDTMSSSSTAATVVVDSTLAPPTIQQPLVHGADVVLHAATKYLAGHSDALVGVLTCSPWTRRGQVLGPILQEVHQSVGGVASTMDSWLTLRGLRTLSTRVTKQCQTAMTLATFLQKQPSVAAVYYPGLSPLSSSSCTSNTSRQQADHAHEIAQRQMRSFGGVLSVEMQSDCHAMAVAGALQTIYRATSLGGTETLVEHRRSIEPPDRATSPPGLLRFSVGLEDVNDLIHDLKNALDIAQLVVEEDGAQDQP
jgi:cystathionine gamma-synthase